MSGTARIPGREIDDDDDDEYFPSSPINIADSKLRLQRLISREKMLKTQLGSTRAVAGGPRQQQQQQQQQPPLWGGVSDSSANMGLLHTALSPLRKSASDKVISSSSVTAAATSPFRSTLKASTSSAAGGFRAPVGQMIPSSDAAALLSSTSYQSYISTICSDDETYMQGLDANKIEIIATDINGVVNNIDCARSFDDIAAIFSNSSKDLTKLGFCAMQLWTLGNDNVFYSTINTHSDVQQQTTIDRKNSTAIVDGIVYNNQLHYSDTKRPESGSSYSNYYIYFDSSSDCFSELETIIRIAENDIIKSAFKRIYILPINSAAFTATAPLSRGSLNGIIIAVEMFNNAIPLSIARRPSFENANRLKVFYAMQFAQKICNAIAFKLSAFNESAERGALKYLSYENLLLAKNNKILLNCSNYLLQLYNASKNTYNIEGISSAIVSHCVENGAIKNAWVLWQCGDSCNSANDHFVSMFHSTSSSSTVANSSSSSSSNGRSMTNIFQTNTSRGLIGRLFNNNQNLLASKGIDSGSLDNYSYRGSNNNSLPTCVKSTSDELFANGLFSKDALSANSSNFAVNKIKQDVTLYSYALDVGHFNRFDVNDASEVFLYNETNMSANNLINKCFFVAEFNDDKDSNISGRDTEAIYDVQKFKFVESFIEILSKNYDKLYLRLKSSATQKIAKLFSTLSVKTSNITKASSSDDGDKSGSNYLIDLINSFASDNISQLLQSKNSTMLVTNNLLYEVSAAGSKIELDNTISFYYSHGCREKNNNSETILRKVLTIKTNTLKNLTLNWLKTLLNGHTIFIHRIYDLSPAELANTDAAIDDVDSYRYSGNYRDTSHNSSLDPSLLQLILSVDSKATSAILIPMLSSCGLALLLLTDRSYEYISGDDSSSASYEIIPGLRGVGTSYSQNDVLSIFSFFDLNQICNSNIQNSLLLLLENILFLQKAKNISNKNKRNNLQLTLLTDYLKRAKDKNLINNCFSRWKIKYNVIAYNNYKNANIKLLSYASSLMKIGTSNTSSVENTKNAFFTQLEIYASKLFPTDAVVFTCNGNSDSELNNLLSISKSGGGNCLTDNIYCVNAFPECETININVKMNISNSSSIYASSRTRNILVAAVKLYIRGTGIAIDDSRSDSASSIKDVRVLGFIKVARAKGSVRTFSDHETSILKKYGDLCSDIYSSLYFGFSTDTSGGNAKGLLIPALLQLLPAVLPLSSRDGSDFRSCMPLAALWAKKLCGAEISVLRMLSTQKNGIVSETVASSEDADSSSLKVVKASGSYDSTAIGGLLIDQSQYHDSNDGTAAALSRSADQISLKLLKDSENSYVVGEFKVIGDGGVFVPEQIAAVQIISYIIAHSFNMAEKVSQLESIGARATDIGRHMESEAASLSKELKQEKGSNDNLRARLAAALSLMVFCSKIVDCIDVEQAALLIADSLPSIIGCKSAAFLLRDQSDESGGSDASYKVILPMRKRAGSQDQIVDSYSIDAIANFIQDPKAYQSKILLSSSTSKNFGCILIFKSLDDASGGNDSSRCWNGLEDVLSVTLHSIVTSSIVRLSANTAIEELVAESASNRSDIDALRRENKKLQEINVKNEMTNNKLLNEISQLKNELKNLSENNNLLIESFNDKMKAYEKDLNAEIAANNVVKSSKAELGSLIMSYSFDHRSQHDTVFQWLCNVADSKACALHTVSQEEGGMLSWQPNAVAASSSAAPLRGVLAAAGEAIRTGNPVEIVTSPSPFSSGNAASSYGKYSTGSGDGSASVLVLVIPNKCIISNEVLTKIDKICFIYCRSISSSDAAKFSDFDRELLLCASTLASRSLFRSRVKYSHDDYLLVDESYQKERHFNAKVSEVIGVCERMWQRGYISRQDVSKAIENAISSLLARGDSDPCELKAMLLFPPVGSTGADGSDPAPAGSESLLYQYLSTLGLHAEVEIVASLLNTSKALYRQSGLLYVSIRNSDGNVMALLRLERKLSAIGNTAAGSHAAGSAGVGLVDLIVTSEEEQLVAIYSRLSFPLLERVKYFAEAYEGVKHAGRAIAALQDAQATTESRLAHEVGSKLQLEDALRAGAALLGTTSSMRYGRGQLIDSARSAVMTITASLECVVIMPNIGDIMLPLLAAAVRPSNSPTVDEDVFTDNDPNALYVLEGDRAYPLKVRLETSDIEAIAMQLGRPVSAPDTASTNDAAAAKSAPRSNSLWHSWVARRVQGQNIVAKASNLKQQRGTLSKGELSQDDTYALAVPFTLRSGAMAVVSVIRREAAFSDTDNECVLWLAKVLSYCLEVRGGDESLADRTKELQKEVERLRARDKRHSLIELDTDSLEKDLLVSSQLMYDNLPNISNSVLGQAADGEGAHSGAITTNNVNLYLNLLTEVNPNDIVFGTAKLLFGAVNVSVCQANELDLFFNSSSSNNIDATGSNIFNFYFEQLQQQQLSGHSFADNADGSAGNNIYGTVCSLNGKVFYFISKNVTSAGAGNNSVNYTSGIPTSSSNALTKKYVELSVDSVMFVAVQHRGFPSPFWLKVAYENSILIQIKLRLTLFLKLLENNEIWKTLYGSMKNLIVHFSSDSNKVTKYQKISENILTCAFVFCNKLRLECSVLDTRRGSNKSSSVTGTGGEWIRKVMLKLCRAFSISTNGDVAVGALTVVQSKEGIGGALAATYAVSWFNNEPEVMWSAGRGYGRDEGGLAESSLEIDRNNPIHTAVNMRCIAIIGGDREEGLYKDTIEHVAQLVGAKRSVAMVIPPTNGYLSGTLIVPILLSHRNMTLVIVVKPPNFLVDNANYNFVSMNSSNSIVLSAMLSGWHSICNCIEESVDIRDRLQRSRQTNQISAVIAINSLLNHRSYRWKDLSYAFMKLKNNFIVHKLSTLYGESSLLGSARLQIRQHEQTLADWTQMVKGLNAAAAAGSPGGVYGLWSQGCKVLMSVISSYTTMSSCGLFVINADGEAVELTVKGLSTPSKIGDNPNTSILNDSGEYINSSPINLNNASNIHDFNINDFTTGNNANSSDQSPDFARGLLEIKTVDRFGDRITNIVLDLLNEQAEVQKVIKLNKQIDPHSVSAITSTAAEEQLWLVPICTARSILGVLRMSVELPAQSVVRDAATAALRTPLHPAAAAAAVSAGDKAYSNKLRIDHASTNAINFAELLAPLMRSAQSIDHNRVLSNKQNELIKKCNAKNKVLLADMMESNKCFALYSNCVNVIGDTIAREPFQGAPLNSSYEAGNTMSVFSRLVSAALSEVIESPVTISLIGSIATTIDSGDADCIDPDSQQHSADHSSAAEVLRESLHHPITGKIMGHVSVAFASAANFNTSDYYDVSTYDANRYKDKTAPSKEHADLVASVLKRLAIFISSVFIQQSREIEKSIEIEITKNELVTFDSLLRKEKNENKNLLYMKNIVEFYRAIADVINQCLVYLASSNENNAIAENENLLRSVSFADIYNNKNLLSFLKNMVIRLPGLMFNSSSSNSSITFSFALISNMLTTSNTMTIDEDTGDITTSADSSNAANNSGANYLYWICSYEHNINAGPTNTNDSICDNIAKSCIINRFKSAVDIANVGALAHGTTMSSYFVTNFSSGVRILSYPLLSTDQSSCVGVMQVCVPAGVDSVDIDDVCDDISRAVACTVFEDRNRRKTHVELYTKHAISNIKDMWRERANGWFSLLMASTNIARGAASNLQVSDILNSESVMSALSDCGVRVRLRYDNVSLSQSDDTVGSGSSARNNLGGATTFIQSFIPLDDRGSVVAEVSFDHNRKTKHFSKELLLKYSNEIVDSFSIIVRNALMQQKIRQNFVDESVVIKSENRNLKNEMIVMNNIKNLLLIENEKLKGITIGSISNYYLPYVVDLMQYINSDDVSDYEGRLSCWDSICKICDRALSRMTSMSPNFKYHFSIIVKEGVINMGSDYSSLNRYDRTLKVNIFDGGRSRRGGLGGDPHHIAGGGGTSAQDVSNVIEHCLASGGCHESTGTSVPADLVGIDSNILSQIADSSSSSGVVNLSGNYGSQLNVLCHSVSNISDSGSTKARDPYMAVVRVVYLNDDSSSLMTMTSSDAVGRNNYLSGDGGESSNSSNILSFDSSNLSNERLIRLMLRPFLEMMSVMITISSKAHSEKKNAFILREGQSDFINDAKKSVIDSTAMLERSKRIYAVVRREAGILLDPPLPFQEPKASIDKARAAHPALLKPAAATTDLSLKLLSMIRTLLRGEGQAVVMMDQAAYKIVLSGNAIAYEGVEQGVICDISKSKMDESTLIETAMSSHKTITVTDALSDARYGASLDGRCVAGTPLLVCPLRGKGGAVVGCFVVARGCTAQPFDTEDIIAAELISALGGLALFWAAGLGPLHQVISKNESNISELEEAIRSMQVQQEKELQVMREALSASTLTAPTASSRVARELQTKKK